MRIVAGKLKGKNLVDSSYLKRSLRPTTDKNREALFSILLSAKFIKEINFSLNDADILDICCGTGAVAFEALSRGAKSALLVDKNFQHLEIAKKNAQLLGVENQTKFLLCDAAKLANATLSYKLVYIDPPYEYNASELIKNLIERNWLDKNSLIIIETAEINFEAEGLNLLDRRRYGKTHFSFYILAKNKLDISMPKI